jgi:hypothetical protein
MNAMTRALTDSEIRAMTALQRLFTLHADIDRKPLNECGWAEFNGISVGGAPLTAESLLADGLMESRPHPMWPRQTQYRLTALGNERAAAYQDDPRYNPYAV